jgi:hypothetical protein
MDEFWESVPGWDGGKERLDPSHDALNSIGMVLENGEEETMRTEQVLKG